MSEINQRAQVSTSILIIVFSYTLKLYIFNKLHHCISWLYLLEMRKFQLRTVSLHWCFDIYNYWNCKLLTFINVDRTFDEAVSATKLIYTKFYHELIMTHSNPRTLKKRFWEEEELSKGFEGHLVEMLHIMFDWINIHKI